MLQAIKCFFGFHKWRNVIAEVFGPTGRIMRFHYTIGDVQIERPYYEHKGKRCDRCGYFKHD